MSYRTSYHPAPSHSPPATSSPTFSPQQPYRDDPESNIRPLSQYHHLEYPSPPLDPQLGSPGDAGRSTDRLVANPRQQQQQQYRDNVHPGIGEGRRNVYEEEEEEFNVEDDFNNVGPRYTDLYGDGNAVGAIGVGREQEKKRPISVRPKSFYSNFGFSGPSPSSTRSMDDNQRFGSKVDSEGVELVTVPALGEEWTNQELHQFTKAHRSELRSDNRRKAWREWKRDQRGLCGINMMTRKGLVIGGFIGVVVTAILLFILIPRPPSWSFPSSNILNVKNDTISFSRTPTNFSFIGELNMFADTSSSYIPIHLSSVFTTVYDLNTNKIIGTGDIAGGKGITLKKGSDRPVTLEIGFKYSALNDTDVSWLDMYDSCKHIYQGVTRPDLQFRVTLETHVTGLVTKSIRSLQVTSLTCPFELSSTSV